MLAETAPTSCRLEKFLGKKLGKTLTSVDHSLHKRDFVFRLLLTRMKRLIIVFVSEDINMQLGNSMHLCLFAACICYFSFRPVLQISDTISSWHLPYFLYDLYAGKPQFVTCLYIKQILQWEMCWSKRLKLMTHNILLQREGCPESPNISLPVFVQAPSLPLVLLASFL